MAKVRIKIVLLGHQPHSIDMDKILKWKSDLFQVTTESSMNIVGDSDGEYWEFTDQNLEEQLPQRDDEDILLAVLNVPLENNWFARRLTNNRVCMTYYEMTEILKSENIPLENLLLRVLYSLSFVYKRYGNRVPALTEQTHYTHDETRGCIFDMNGIKKDVVYSLNKPQLCHSCVEDLTSNPGHRLEKNIVEKVQQELKHIKKDLYFRLTDWVKLKPIWAIVISSIFALTIGIISSIIATLILAHFTK